MAMIVINNDVILILMCVCRNHVMCNDNEN